MVVNELVSRFSFIGDLSPQREFNENLKLSIAGLAGVAAGLSAAAVGLFAFVASGTEASDKLTDVSAEIGVSVEALQELGFAAELSGSSAEQMTASLSGLAKVAGDASRGLGRGKKAFEELGISVKDAGGNVKTADVIFGELSARFRALDTDMATQKSIIAALGLDPSTLQLLNSTTGEVAALVEQARALGIVTTEQAEASAKFQDSLAVAKFGVSALRQQVAIGLAPAMTDITNRFIGFLEANHELIEDGLKYLGEILISTMGFMERMTPIVLMVAAAFGVAWLATGGFATVLAIAMSPVLLITLAIIALLLIVDDLITAFNGGQSVIADFFMEFLGVDIVPIMKGIVAAFMSMVDGVIAYITKLWDSWKLFTTAIVQLFMGDWDGALKSLEGAFASFGEAIKMAFGGIFDFLAKALGQIIGGIKSAATSMLPDWAVKLIGQDGAPEPQGGAGRENMPALPSGSGQAASDVPMIDSFSGDVPMLTPNQAMGISNSSSSVSNSNIEQNIEIKVSAPDAQAAGAAVSDSLQDQLQTAKTQVNRGGR